MIVRQLFSYLGSRHGKARLAIFIFHRVLRAPDVLRPNEPDRARFRRICHFLAGNYSVMSLSEGVERMLRGALPKAAACITFDDGYRDNYELALPILEEHGLVGTFFIATSFLDAGRMWNDTVIESFRALPEGIVDLSSVGLGTALLHGPNARRECVEKTIRTVKYLGLDRRRAVCDELGALAGLPRKSDLMMTLDQVRQLSNSGMEIGAHTHSHPILKTLAPEIAREEIRTGRRILEEVTRQPVHVFAYPNGRPGQDYDSTHVDMVRNERFVAAVSTARGIATHLTDALQLPRFTPWDQDMWRFVVRCGLELYDAR